MGLFASRGWDNVQAECNTGDGLAQVNECLARTKTARGCADYQFVGSLPR